MLLGVEDKLSKGILVEVSLLHAFHAFSPFLNDGGKLEISLFIEVPSRRIDSSSIR